MYNYPIYSVTYPQYFKSGTPKPDPEPVYYPERFTYDYDSKGVYCVSGVVSDYINEPEIVVPKTDTEGNVVEGIKDYAFKNVKAQNVIILNNIIKIGNYAFSHCTALESIKLSESITTVGYQVFEYCGKLLDLTIPKGINTYNTSTYISFLTGSSIKNIVIEDGRTVINNNMFYGAQKVTNIEIPESVTIIGKSAFRECKALTNIKLPKNLTTIDNYAFDYCSSLTSIELPESVTTVGESVFSNCTKLLNLTIPKGINTFNTSTYTGFLTDSYIKNIIIEDGRTAINDYMLYGGQKVTNIEIPESVTIIGKSAFRDCQFSSIKIPEGVTRIGSYAFDYCTALTDITLPESLQSVGDQVFRGCSKLLDLTIPKGIISFPTGYSKFLSESYIQNIIIEDGREVIPDYMISSANKLKSVTIPNSVITIGNYAFSNCSSLTSIELPKNVRTMGGYVFSGCDSLKTLTIPNSLTVLSSTISPLNSSYITKVIFKMGRTEIPENMCKSSTSIIDIDIPSTLQTVKKNAFYGCSKLATINYNGTEQMFNAITVESGNPKFLEATVIFQ